MNEKREVSFAEGMEFAKQNDMIFLECSAKDGSGIFNIFKRSAETIIGDIQNKILDPNVDSLGISLGFSNQVNHDLLNKIQNKKKKNCC